VTEPRNGNATGSRAERETEDVVKDGDILGRGGTLKGVNEVFLERVGGRPAAGEKFEGAVDGIEFVPGVADEFAGVHGVKERRLRGGMVENDGVIGTAEGLGERAGLSATKGHGVSRGGGSNGLNAWRRGGGLWGGGGQGGFGPVPTLASGDSGEGKRGGR